jgi:FtsP/CotA-like multicopper oxidase with cupredoxin domain
MTMMTGFLGNQILVNGLPNAQYTLKTGIYRFRILNGSNSRILNIAWDNGLPLTVIGTDGGLLEAPIEKDFIALAPAQRVELWVDLTADQAGATRNLVSLPHPAPGGEDTYSLLSITVEEASTPVHHLPETLSTVTWEQENQAVNLSNPRNFQLSMGRGMQFLLNNKEFDMDAVASNEKVRLGDLELWEFENVASGMGMMGNMALPHPMHIHGLQFQVIERDWARGNFQLWKSMVSGCVDEGWHDTVLVHPGEKVKLLMRFADFPGLYLYHCHNLEHEDMGMMRNFLIES